MAEDENVMIEADSISLEDTEDSVSKAIESIHSERSKIKFI